MLPESTVGKIVRVEFEFSVWVGLVTSADPIKGDVIALDRPLKEHMEISSGGIRSRNKMSQTNIYVGEIKNFEILSKKDLPLLIGYKYKSELFERLLKGEE